MSQSEKDSSESDESDNEPIPFMQRLLDNSFLLLFIGVASPAAAYLIWGVIDIISIPIAP